MADTNSAVADALAASIDKRSRRTVSMALSALRVADDPDDAKRTAKTANHYNDDDDSSDSWSSSCSTSDDEEARLSRSAPVSSQAAAAVANNNNRPIAIWHDVDNSRIQSLPSKQANSSSSSSSSFLPSEAKPLRPHEITSRVAELGVAMDQHLKAYHEAKIERSALRAVQRLQQKQ